MDLKTLKKYLLKNNAGVKRKLKYSCDKFYIGNTNRNLKINYKEHTSNVKLMKAISNKIFLNI